MPYVDEGVRIDLDLGSPPYNGGDLNYLITKVITRYVKHHGRGYGTFNDVLGALEGAKTEFYRRVVAPYEDSKIEINGDVYDGCLS